MYIKINNIITGKLPRSDHDLWHNIAILAVGKVK